MITFEQQLTRVRTNLERLEALHKKHPALFAYANGIDITEGRVWVWIHSKLCPNLDWLALIRQAPSGDWKRERGVDPGTYDWHGTVNGVQFSILGPEKCPELEFPDLPQSEHAPAARGEEVAA